MLQNIKINALKQIHVKDSPFDIIVYILKDSENILIEDQKTGKSILIHSSYINEYLKIANNETNWIKSFNGVYTKYKSPSLFHFMPINQSKEKYVTLSFQINKMFAPRIKTQYSTEHKCHIVLEVDETDPEYQRTHKYLYKNIKDFKTKNFEITMIDYETAAVKFNNSEPMKLPIIICKLPIFEIFMCVQTPENSKTIGIDQIFIKIENEFYRFPYGNSSSSDKLCLGEYIKHSSIKENVQIQDFLYTRLISSPFNGDYIAHIRHNNDVQTSLDLEDIKTKINNDDFNISFIDMIYYLSQCKSIKDINKKIFLLTPNIPDGLEEILT